MVAGISASSRRIEPRQRRADARLNMSRRRVRMRCGRTEALRSIAELRAGAVKIALPKIVSQKIVATRRGAVRALQSPVRTSPGGLARALDRGRPRTRAATL